MKYWIVLSWPVRGVSIPKIVGFIGEDGFVKRSTRSDLLSPPSPPFAKLLDSYEQAYEFCLTLPFNQYSLIILRSDGTYYNFMQ